ncbi:hypothetical protein CANCADRAFT_13491, partial [Tortispora caseinolytica NRRL Y-17796]
IVGSTGQVGHKFLVQALALSNIYSSVYALSRAALPSDLDKDFTGSFQNVVSKDVVEAYKAEVPSTDVFFSGLGTTKALAGGKENQYKIDHDMNIELAKEAKDHGVKTYVIVSAMGADSSSSIFYNRMKGEIERDIIALNFDKTVILRPGMII